MRHEGFLPADLEIRVRTHSESGRTRLLYELNSPTGVVSFMRHEIVGPTFQGNPEELHRNLIHQLEALGDGLDVDEALAMPPEVKRKLEGIGRDLWRELFNDEMRTAYRRFRDPVQTLWIISDEPWIPWEMIKPFDDQGDLLDDDFLAARFELTRWLAGNRNPPGQIEVSVFSCLSSGADLPMAAKEEELVMALAQSHAGLRDASPTSSSMDELMPLLEKGGIGLLHFAGHGTFDPALANQAGFPLADGSVFRPSDLHGPVQTQIAKDRPLVFLNACSSGRQGWSWTGLGGWAERWVRVCGCGAFLGPQWKVKDSVALSFACALYESLARGETLGTAAKLARYESRKTAPESPSWLAYAVYGHPNTRVVLGQAASARSNQQTPRSVLSRTSYSDSTHSPKAKPPVDPAPGSSRTASPCAEPAAARSSNRRIKQRFTDRDRDQFIEESFDYIAGLFESSLTALGQENSRIESRFRRVDPNKFTAVIYVGGKKESSCRVWIDRSPLGDIAYVSGDSGSENTYNEALTADNDGYSQFFRPLGLRSFGPADRQPLTRQAAAEFLWSILIEPLQ